MDFTLHSGATEPSYKLKSKDYEMDCSADTSKDKREPFGTLIIYIAPVIPIAMFAATEWIGLSV